MLPNARPRTLLLNFFSGVPTWNVAIGQRITNSPTRGILVFESHHSSAFSMPPERRTFHKLCWVPVGHGSTGVWPVSVTLARDELVFVPAESTHRFVDDHAAPMTLVMAYFSDEVVQQSSPLAPGAAGGTQKEISRTLPAGEAEHLPSRRRPRRLRACGGAAPHDAESTAMLAVRIAGPARPLLARRPDRQVGRRASKRSRVRSNISTIYSTRHTGVKDLADMCGIGGRRYSDIFKQRTGKTVVQYLNQKRVAYAQERLRETGQIMYAAVAAGFSDATHFLPRLQTLNRRDAGAIRRVEH